MRILDEYTKRDVQTVIDANMSYLTAIPGFVSAEPGFQGAGRHRLRHLQEAADQRPARRPCAAPARSLSRCRDAGRPDAPAHLAHEQYSDRRQRRGFGLGRHLQADRRESDQIVRSRLRRPCRVTSARTRAGRCCGPFWKRRSRSSPLRCTTSTHRAAMRTVRPRHAADCHTRRSPPARNARWCRRYRRSVVIHPTRKIGRAHV